MVTLCLAAPLLFFYRKRWSLIVLQVLAYCAAGTWIAVAIQLVQTRQQLGQPWTIAAIILRVGGVGGFFFVGEGVGIREGEKRRGERSRCSPCWPGCC